MLQFESDDGPGAHAPPIDLEAQTLEQAKAKAAMLYAGASFRATPPTAFSILKDGATVVYRFPETP